ncbi:MAG: MATE family efflux transporter [Eubacterium sp.]|nr:MATE family efflux transporter [Eubacterium sp.]
MMGRLYMRLLPVQIILVIISGVNNVIDSTFASNLIGPEAMAVAGLFFPVLNLINSINVLFAGGSQIMCGRYLGKHMVDRTKSIFTLDMLAVTCVTVSMVVICEIIPEPVSALLGAEGVYTGQLASYIRGFVIGLLPQMIGTQLSAFLQIEQQEKRTYIAIAGMLVSNIFFNWLFIAVMDMGFFGLGLATSVSNTVFFLIQVVYYFSKKAVMRFSLRSVIKSDLKDILKTGFPSAITQFCILIRLVIVNYLLRDYVGPDGLQAYAAVMSFGSMYWACAAGVTSAVTMLASIHVGEEDREGLRSLMRVFLKRGLVLFIFTTIVYMALCVPLTNIFFHDPAAPVYDMAMMGFFFFPLSLVLSTLNMGYTNYVHCLGTNEGFIRFTALFDGAIGVAGLSLICIPLFEMPGAWFAQVANGFLLSLILLLFVIVKNRRFPRCGDDMMCFQSDFGAKEGDRIDITVHSMEEALQVSEEVTGFCLAHGSTRRIANKTSLCIEELVTNIVKHGFDDKKKHHIDMSVTYVNRDIVINIKDDCRAFNPKEYAELFDPEDRTHNIGLRLIAGIARDMIYQNTYGLNILTIIL